MVKRLVIISTLLIAPLVPAGAQLSCVTAPSVQAQWPSPLDRQVVIGDGVLSVRDAIERAGTVARVHFTYQADLLPQDRTVCAGAAKMRLGDALVQWLDGSRLKAVVAGEDRVVLALVRAVSAPAPASAGSAMATAQLAPVVVVEQGQPPVRENETISRTVVSGEQLEATGSPTMAQALSGAVPGLWMWNPSPTSIGGGMGQPGSAAAIVRRSSARAASRAGLSRVCSAAAKRRPATAMPTDRYCSIPTDSGCSAFVSPSKSFGAAPLRRSIVTIAPSPPVDR